MSAASPSTWMPTYWGSYAKKTGHFGALLHGSYLMLIKHYWCTGGPPADDDAQLWRIATCDSIQQWRKIVRPMVAPLFDIRDGHWHHHKVEEELAKARAFIEKQALNGGKGGRPPKNPEKTQTETQTKPNANPTTNPEETTTPTPTKSSDKSEDTRARDFQIWFKAYPRRTAIGRARKAYAAALKKTDAATLLAGAEAAAVKYAQTEPQFIPHPATWLNDERWLDQQPTEQVKNGHGQSSDPWEQRVHGYRQGLDGNGRPFWSGFWGPKPDEPGCNAPLEILERHGFGKKAA
jgi:uncharacterized protein YdaU (DUF1376 family)